ncbi:peptide ABC transporter ATP-binding protein [Aureimonas endophytica]|uniref:Peptide ABC transporter ATP-binding protein n=1 Tax=Aureimonas endophytica TaxID=2027858 RepID=A0A916ZRG0_9HYPH|nr:ABC transporter ATP-binding protein [Aureimonas endophytica]GGE10436.1 peptide ABC transporter ATP-binding protein [Aureimonas endophytica]
MMAPREDDKVDVRGLRVTVPGADGTETAIVENIDFTIARGEVLALIGESGSGKTTIALATMGYARPGCRLHSGSIRVFGMEIVGRPEGELRRLRGNRIAYIAQSAAAAFNPGRTIMAQVIESAVIHGSMRAEAARDKAKALFAELALPDPETIGERYPHQVSGGQLQRLLAAMALLNDPDLVIFDEPTTALDVTTQIEVLIAFKAAIRERGITGIYVSHDLAVVAQIADRIAVLKGGKLQEAGEVARMIAAPSHPYTRQLLAAAAPADRRGGTEPRPAGEILLEGSGILAGYGRCDRDGLPKYRVLEEVGFRLARGRTLGVIGESGSGKSTLARVVAGILPPTRGEVRLAGRALAPALGARTREDLRRVQIVFQNADTALNPGRTIGEILARPLAFYGRAASARERERRVAMLLDRVRLPASVAGRLPRELSGGQKQRANLARALAADPEVILCDEVTSALDTVVGEAILDLLAELQRELAVSYLFISHDLGVVRALSDEILVLKQGRIVETGPTETVLAAPRADYTRQLLASVPELRPGWLEEVAARRGLAA